MPMRLEDQRNATPQAIARGEIKSYSQTQLPSRRLNLYTGTSGEFPISNIPGFILLWGPQAFAAASDVAGIQQQYPEAAGREPVGFPASVRYVQVGMTSRVEAARFDPQTEDLAQQIEGLRRLANGARLKFVLIGGTDSTSLPTLYLGSSGPDHVEIVGDRHPKNVLDAGYIEIERDEAGNYGVVVDQESVGITNIDPNARQSNRTIVGQTMASLMQLVRPDRTKTIDVTLKGPRKSFGEKPEDWGHITITSTSPEVATTVSSEPRTFFWSIPTDRRPARSSLADIDSLLNAGISPEMRHAFAMVLNLVRSMRTAATSEQSGIDPQLVLADTQRLVDLMSRRIVTQLLDNDNQELLTQLEDQLQAAWETIEPKYRDFPRTAIVGVGGGISKLVNIHSARLYSPYESLTGNSKSWERTFGFQGSPEEGQRYLIFSPLSADYMEAYTLNLYYQMCYEKRNRESVSKGFPSVVVPQSEVVPVAFSKDLSRVAYPQVELRGGESARVYLDTTEWGDTQKATQRVIMGIDPELLPKSYREFHGLS